MKATIEPSAVSGSVTAPPSKSMTQRAYAAALLHKGRTVIHGAGTSDDERAAYEVIQQLGARTTARTAEQTDMISEGVLPESQVINCGESGLAARLFTPIAAISGDKITIEGTGSLLSRPMQGFDEVLSGLGVTINGFNGYLPLTIQGPLQARSVHVDASSGSQFLSGILFALSGAIREPVTITVTDLKSKPYIDMTLDVLRHFGKPIKHDNYCRFDIDPALFTQKGDVEITVEADWSSAAGLLVAGAIAGNVTVRGLNSMSAQADRAILDVLKMAGAAVTIKGDEVSVQKSELQAFEFDATDCPDLFPILAIFAACCEGESYIKGVHRLYHKESNRAESITEMLMNFDVPFSVEDDSLCINGVDELQGTVIESFNDHRIVMAAAVGALRAGSRVDIMDADAVSKSYPDFFKDLVLCGGKCIFK